MSEMVDRISRYGFDPMQDIGRAIDLWIGELARLRKSRRTRETYNRQLQRFADTLPPYTAVGEITADDCRRFLDIWRDAAPSTMASGVSILRGFFRFLIDEGHVPEPGPMARIKRPRRPRAEDLDVVTISTADARALINACATWQELLCLSTALYTGRRRAALNAAVRRDVDLGRATVKFRDKGDKVIVQPVPDEYADIIRAADAEGIWATPGDYLIPNRRPAAMRRTGLRSDKVIWLTVKRVAEAAGVESHVHALRAAFAVQFDETHPGRIDSLKDLLGHQRLETTEVYLRRKDRAASMDVVRDLSWGSPVRVPFQETPANSNVRPIRDSNPCPRPSELLSALDANAELSRSPMLDAKLRELTNRVRTRSSRSLQ